MSTPTADPGSPAAPERGDGGPDEHQSPVRNQDGQQDRGRHPLALVTGASRGIGRAIAHELGVDHHVLLGGRDPDALRELAGQLPSAEPFPVDLRDPEATALAVSRLGLSEGLDVLVHSAGVLVPGRLADLDPEDWERSLTSNVTAVAGLTRHLLPSLRAARGTIVAVNSGSGFSSGAAGGAYAASKFALRALTDALREEEREHGVRVCSVHPGRVDTDMQRELRRAEQGPYEPERYLRPESVASAVAFAVRAPADACIETLSIRPRG